MPAMQKAERSRGLAGVRPRSRGRSADERSVDMKRFPGRLNLFQQTMLDWRELHPYVAVHAVEIDRALDAAAVTRAIDETLSQAGLTGLELDRANGRYAWRGGPASCGLEVIAGGADWQVTLANAFERHL